MPGVPLCMPMHASTQEPARGSGGALNDAEPCPARCCPRARTTARAPRASRPRPPTTRVSRPMFLVF
eukprot:15455915-Alexandrium_andersonii.AAC.1